MITWIDQNLALIITGSILGLATSFIYSTGHNAFLSRGNFQSKTSATEIISAAILLRGLSTPVIHRNISIPLSYRIGTLSLAGLVIILVASLNNKEVTNRKFQSKSSAEIYGIGLLLILADLLLVVSEV
ncbi:hypothetical protein ACK3SF_02810 [Candidatus Nanosalina sp. VS9-1]|uniref:hypothetical protein n=1 Tax=Candidatus Nanosalina sp. VS9-1 TaxID=3388566 RepID=UPI0039E1335A